VHRQHPLGQRSAVNQPIPFDGRHLVIDVHDQSTHVIYGSLRDPQGGFQEVAFAVKATQADLNNAVEVIRILREIIRINGRFTARVQVDSGPVAGGRYKNDFHNLQEALAFCRAEMAQFQECVKRCEILQTAPKHVGTIWEWPKKSR
jgi:hypothetical protein